MTWLVDTTTLLVLANRAKSYERIARKLAGRAYGEVRMSAVTLAEVEYAAETSRHPGENQAALEDVVGLIQVEAWPAEAAPHFAKLKAALQEDEQEIRPYDLLIAAHALAVGATLVTAEPQAFAEMPGLRLVNWLKV